MTRKTDSRRRSRRVALTLLMGALAALATPHVAEAQAPGWDPTDVRATRDGLESLRQRYLAAANSPAYSPVLQAEARAQAALLEARLAEGDYRVGDRVMIVVEDHPALTDTFTIEAGQTVTLPQVGTVALRGVLRSELHPVIAQAIARTIRDPRVQTLSLIRIGLEGAVAAPGYYLVDSDLPASDLLMLAGGPSPEARLQQSHVVRGERTTVEAEQLAEAFRNGATVASLDIQSGDRLIVPMPPRESPIMMARELFLLVPAALGLLSLVI